MKGKFILLTLVILLLAVSAVSYAGDISLTKGITYYKCITQNM